MAKFISDIHEFVKFLTGKGQTGYHSPEEIDNAVHAASKGLFDEKRKLFQFNHEITEDLKPFLSNPTALSPDGSGQVDYPEDYCVVSSIRAGNKSVSIVDDSVLADKLDDPNAPPTTSYPICAFYKEYIQFYPTTGLTNIKITFLKNPVKAVWAYTIVSDRFVYDDDSSVDVEWKEPNHMDLIVRTLSFLGINLREGELLQYAELKKNQVV